MELRFREKGRIFDILITVVSLVVSVGTVIYGMVHLGLSETWPELVLNLFYIACIVMILMYFFNRGITTMQFNYWCSVCVGATIVLRDIVFAPPLAIFPVKIGASALSLLLLLMLTFFYSRREWETYSKRNLWMICIIDMVIAALYHLDIYLEPVNDYTDYLITEIWIRPTITYALVACFVSEKKALNQAKSNAR